MQETTKEVFRSALMQQNKYTSKLQKHTNEHLRWKVFFWIYYIYIFKMISYNTTNYRQK